MPDPTTFTPPLGSDPRRPKPGDGLLLYTDGVTEAMNAAGALYGEDRLLQTMKGLLGMEDEGVLIDGVLKDIDVFVGGAEQSDDITMLGFKLVSPYGSKGSD